MRQLKSVKPEPIKLSEMENLKSQGFLPLDAGDASKANSDYFMVVVNQAEDGSKYVQIVCPTFLRGPLGFSIEGGFSY